MPRKFRSKPKTGGRRTRRRFKRKSMRRRKARRDAPTRIVTRQMGGFPDRYFCRVKCANNETQVTATLAAYWSWIGNGVAVGAGPSKQGSSYENNYCAGVSYLLGNAGDKPALAPYILCRVWASSIKISYTPTSSGPATVSMVVFPGINDARNIGSGATSAAFGVTSEQAYAKTRSGPGNQTSKPMVIKSFMSTRKIYGYHKAAIEGNPNFYHSYNTNPNSLWFWNMYIYGDGTTTPLSGNVTFEIIYYCEFFARSNQFASAAPS